MQPINQLYEDVLKAGLLVGLKAPRTIPGQSDPLNPDGVKMRRLEKWGQNLTLKALRKMQRDLLRGASNPFEIQARFNSPEIQQPFKKSINKMINKYTLDGADFGRFQVESEIFGIKQIDMWELANIAAAEWAQQHAGQLIGELNTTTQRRLQRLISQSIDEGGTIGELTSAIRQSGIFGESRARMIAVTELTTSFANGNMISWKQSGVVEKKEWRTNNDEIVRECPICWPLHEKQADLDEPFEHPNGNTYDSPSAHPHDRCWIVPVVK